MRLVEDLRHAAHTIKLAADIGIEEGLFDKEEGQDDYDLSERLTGHADTLESKRELKIGQTVTLPDGTWRAVEFCDEPNTGLVMMEAVYPIRAVGIAVPVTWVERLIWGPPET